MTPDICHHNFKISLTSRSTTIKTNFRFNVMFSRPENEISKSVKVVGFLFLFNSLFYLFDKNIGSAGSAACNPQFSNTAIQAGVIILQDAYCYTGKLVTLAKARVGKRGNGETKKWGMRGERGND